MSRDKLSDAATDVVQDARALASYIKARNLQVLSAEVRPQVQVCFYSSGASEGRDSVTEVFVELTETLKTPELSASRIDDSVLLTASGTYKHMRLDFKLYAQKYESRLLVRELPGLDGVDDHVNVTVSREALEAAIVLLSEHADDCDLTCQQYGQVPCYADRAL